jgi:hypothetical protein
MIRQRRPKTTARWTADSAFGFITDCVTRLTPFGSPSGMSGENMKRKTAKTAAGKSAAEVRIPKNAVEVASLSEYTVEWELLATPAGEFYLQKSQTLLDGKPLPPMSDRLMKGEFYGDDDKARAARKARLREKITVTRMDAHAALMWILSTNVHDDGAIKQFLGLLKGVRPDCYTVTLSPELSRQWDAAAKRARLPLDWMIHDDLAKGAESYLDDIMGWRESSRKLWRSLPQGKRKVPIQVAKG